MAPNANPSNCGGVSTFCCGNRLPEVLKAVFSGANTCGFNSDAYLVWDGGTWTLGGLGCGGGLTVTVRCGPVTWTMSISGSAVCLFSCTLSSSVCDGPDGFKLVFSVTQQTPPMMNCPCCANLTTFTVTLTNGLAP